MCKLNIFCKEIDGKCNCGNTSPTCVEQAKPLNGLLCAILDYVKGQPEIWTSLVEDYSCLEGPLSQEYLENDRMQTVSPTQASSLGEYEELLLENLGDPINTIFIGKCFSLMLEVSNRKFNRVKLANPIRAIVTLEDRVSSEVKLVLGEIQSTGTIFFKNLMATQEFENVRIAVRTSHEDIQPYLQDVRIRKRKEKKNKSK